MPLTAVLVTGLLGLVVGSFLNVVIHRWPREESLSHPGSHCPECLAPIRTRHNVPVLGWLILRGHCADCRAPISPRYPIVELLTGVVFAGLAWRLEDLGRLPALPAYLFIGALGIALSGIDVDLHRLPDRLVLPSYPVLFLLLGGAAAWAGDGADLLRALAAGVVLAGCYQAIRMVAPEGMGGGDVTLAGLLGASLGYLSWSTLLIGGFGAFVLGALVGLTLIGLGRATRKTPIAFGPFMVAAALGAVLLGRSEWLRDVMVAGT